MHQRWFGTLCILTIASACHTEGGPSVPEGDWANVSTAVVDEVVGGYAHVTEGGWQFWIQAPAAGVSVGDHVLVGTGPDVGPVQVDGRSLKVVVDAQLAVVDPQTAALALKMPSVSTAHTEIASVYARSVSLAGKSVTVSGRVVKASMGVFGTNWYHLRDGSGGEGTNDLTITSPATLAVGDLLLASGTLVTDKDLGFGYFYDVIIEGAEVRGLDGSLIAVADDTRAPSSDDPGAGRSDEAPKAAAPVPERKEAPVLGPTAPGGRGLYGLELGDSGEADITAWLRQRGLTCDSAPNLSRKTFHYRCKNPDPSALTDRTIGGVLDEILLARPEAEGGALHHFSSVRKYSAPAQAAEDWRRAAASLRERLGDPIVEHDLAEAATLEGRVAYRLIWRWDDLEVGLTMMRLRSSSPLSISERWFVPGVEEAAGDRGISVHGGGFSRSPNPHVSDVHPGGDR